MINFESFSEELENIMMEKVALGAGLKNVAQVASGSSMGTKFMKTPAFRSKSYMGADTMPAKKKFLAGPSNIVRQKNYKIDEANVQARKAARKAGTVAPTPTPQVQLPFAH